MPLRRLSSRNRKVIKKRWSTGDFSEPQAVPPAQTTPSPDDELYLSKETQARHIDFLDPSIIGEILDLFTHCKEQTHTRFLSTLVYMVLRHFRHSWREIDEFLKQIGAMTAETCHKWSYVLRNNDFDEFT